MQYLAKIRSYLWSDSREGDNMHGVTYNIINVIREISSHNDKDKNKDFKWSQIIRSETVASLENFESVS
jgi:hypothetical protein